MAAAAAAYGGGGSRRVFPRRTWVLPPLNWPFWVHWCGQFHTIRPVTVPIGTGNVGKIRRLKSHISDHEILKLVEGFSYPLPSECCDTKITMIQQLDRRNHLLPPRTTATAPFSGQTATVTVAAGRDLLDVGFWVDWWGRWHPRQPGERGTTAAAEAIPATTDGGAPAIIELWKWMGFLRLTALSP